MRQFPSPPPVTKSIHLQPTGSGFDVTIGTQGSSVVVVVVVVVTLGKTRIKINTSTTNWIRV